MTKRKCPEPVVFTDRQLDTFSPKKPVTTSAYNESGARPLKKQNEGNFEMELLELQPILRLQISFDDYTFIMQFRGPDIEAFRPKIAEFAHGAQKYDADVV